MFANLCTTNKHASSSGVQIIRLILIDYTYVKLLLESEKRGCDIENFGHESQKLR